MVAPFGPSPGVARVVSLRSLRVPPRHYLPGTAWGKVQEYWGSADVPKGNWNPTAVTEHGPQATRTARTRCDAAAPLWNGRASRTRHDWSGTVQTLRLDRFKGAVTRL